MEHNFTEENRFLKCSCGSRQPISKMQSVDNRFVCQRCAKLAQQHQKRKAKYAEEYQVTVTLLDGTRLFYQPIGG